MSQDVLDDADVEGVLPTLPQGNKPERRQRALSIEALHSEMQPVGRVRKESARKAFRTLLNVLRLRKCASADISTPDPTFKVAYLGNVVTGWAKGDGCMEKPLATLWRNYTQSSRGDVRMQLTVSGGGLRATTKDHGLTEYWAHRLTSCAAPPLFPRLFCWVYRHEGRRLRHELRCHAVLCSSASVARQIETHLKNSLQLALSEFRRDKISKQNARLSLVNSVYENPTIPRRKILLSTGSHNYRPPLERSKSAPKLTMIEEHLEEDDEVFERRALPGYLLKDCDRSRGMRLRFATKLDELKELQEIQDDKEQLILEDYDEHELLEPSKEVQQWFSETQDLIPSLDSDEGSLSSGCESASTVTSDLEQPPYTPLTPPDTPEEPSPERKTDSAPDFKLGERVLTRVCSLERLINKDKVKPLTDILDPDEVSLVPVGETHSQDFSSLKVFKKRVSSAPPEPEFCTYEVDEQEGGSENGSACSDESGYDELLDCNSSVSNIVLV